MQKYTNLNIEHLPYKNTKKSIFRIRRLFLFSIYLSFFILLIKFFDSPIIKDAFAKTIMIIKNDQNDKWIYEEMLKLQYITSITDDDNISKSILKYSKIYDIEPTLLLAIIKTESSFNPYAKNKNKNGSIDRGLCQLNNKTFSYLKPEDFYDPEINIKNASMYLKWCFKTSNNNLIKTLAFYNAGIGNVTKKKIGEATLDYINNVINEKNYHDTNLKVYISENYY